MSDWFIERVREGGVSVENPYNRTRARLSLLPSDVDAFVFWSKDPRPLIPYLDELDQRGYGYLFLFTLNGYGPELEPGIPPMPQRLDTFLRLSDRLGPERVVFRYDPIILSNRTPPSFHEETFATLSGSLRGQARRVVVSLLDHYPRIAPRLATLEAMGWTFDRRSPDNPDVRSLLAELCRIAQQNGMQMAACAEEADFSAQGIPAARCVDASLIRTLFGKSPSEKKDPSQRPACGCHVSRDIGTYGTCRHGCVYCYAG